MNWTEAEIDFAIDNKLVCELFLTDCPFNFLRMRKNSSLRRFRFLIHLSVCMQFCVWNWFIRMMHNNDHRPLAIRWGRDIDLHIEKPAGDENGRCSWKTMLSDSNRSCRWVCHWDASNRCDIVWAESDKELSDSTIDKYVELLWTEAENFSNAIQFQWYRIIRLVFKMERDVPPWEWTKEERFALHKQTIFTLFLKSNVSIFKYSMECELFECIFHFHSFFSFHHSVPWR